ncbi:hypothetical protein [Thermoleptolyngbya sp.]
MTQISLYFKFKAIQFFIWETRRPRVDWSRLLGGGQSSPRRPSMRAAT